MCSRLLTLAALGLALAGSVAAEASWNWPDGQQRPANSPASTSAPVSRDTPSVSGRRFADVPGRPRYEITDPDSDDFTLPHPEDLLPNRPFSRPPISNRPFENNYPLLNPNAGYRPPRPLPPQGPLGPVNRPPPGVDRYDPSDVSKCKCVHAFNCEGNALQFGSCDVGKRYCCSKEPRSLGPRPGGYGSTPGGPGQRPGVLTGPGGPTGFGPVKDDRFDRYPGTSPYDRYPGSGASPYDRYPGSGASPYDRYPGSGSSPYDRFRGDRYPGSRPDVLVGPRPTPYRPDPAAGFATRPGDYPIRGLNSPYRDYDNYNRGYGLGGRS
ncbi:translation initiation factor IF-2-like [Frankliniella occidentalis]|uniref:Translation initiation factor IF-2-like n=1 Tax=Frankliniella occidentalis TaxID=133901 RepID=A0A6J1T8F4_FRAOC|nr:translation initiation factor IF-2-like [Frankliniella occidentalis]